MRPNEYNLSIDDKKELFAIRNGMIEIKEKFSNMNIRTECICGATEDMIHIFNCSILNKEESKCELKDIYKNDMKYQIEPYNRMKEVLKIKYKIHDVFK